MGIGSHTGFYIMGIVFSLMILSSNCSKVEELPVGSLNGEDLLVVNSILSPDTVISLNLTKSVSVNSPDKFLYLMNADVAVYEDNAFLCNLNYEDKGNYIAPGIKPKPGRRYQIIVNEPGFEIISAETELKESPDVIGLDTVSYRDEAGHFLKISMNYKTNGGDSCYYFINVFKFENLDNKDGKEINIHQPSFNKIEVLKGGVFGDEGKTANHSICFSVKYDELGTGIHILFSSISQAYFRYILSYCIYLENKLEWDNLSGPVPVYGNIHGGLGIFGSANSWSGIIAINTN
jgi:hypothetical protein